MSLGAIIRNILHDSVDLAAVQTIAKTTKEINSKNCSRVGSK